MDQPTTPKISAADFADDKIIYSSYKNSITAGYNIQYNLNLMSSWYTKWKIKINHKKSQHLTFALKRGIVPGTAPVILNSGIIQKSTNSRYLGSILDQRLIWVGRPCKK